MERILQYNITGVDAGKQIQNFLLEKGYSRQNLTDLKKMPESILVNGRWEYVKYVLEEHDCLTVHIQEMSSSERIEPEELPLDICYEDEDILVVNKPANMPVHPSLNHYYGTLANAIAHYYKKQGQEYVFRCINRLDRDTTGLVILAKHMVSGAILGQAMIERRIHREYLALVAGEDMEDMGTVDAPIARKNQSLIERMVSSEGQRAVTHYKVLERKNGISLVSLHLETGRTHQIRVHMKHIGHPLIGDSLYAPEYMLMDRQALHSYQLEFTHPITGEQLILKQDLPKDMQRLLMDVSSQERHGKHENYIKLCF